MMAIAMVDMVMEDTVMMDIVMEDMVMGDMVMVDMVMGDMVMVDMVMGDIPDQVTVREMYTVDQVLEMYTTMVTLTRFHRHIRHQAIVQQMQDPDVVPMLHQRQPLVSR